MVYSIEILQQQMKAISKSKKIHAKFDLIPSNVKLPIIGKNGPPKYPRIVQTNVKVTSPFECMISFLNPYYQKKMLFMICKVPIFFFKIFYDVRCEILILPDKNAGNKFAIAKAIGCSST